MCISRWMDKEDMTYLHSEIFSSVQSSCSVVSDSLRPHESQHARPPCPSSTPGVHSDSRLSSRWCHPAISSSVIPFFSCPQSLPASESFPTSQFFAHSGIKENESLSFTTTWIDSESITLSKISQIEKDRHHMISLICEVWKRKIKQTKQK